MKKLLSIVLIVTMLMSMVVAAIPVNAADASDGTNAALEAEGYKAITNLGQLRAGGKFYLKNDLTVNGRQGMPSNVTLDGITYKIEGEGEHGDPYAAFLSIIDSANVLIENSTLQAHRYYWCVGSGGGAPVGMGTYAISADNCNNVIWRNCTQSNFFADDGVSYRSGIWGIMGSSYSKNLAYENCVLSRFDAHAGVYNSRIVNSTLASFRIIGGGDIVIDNCHIYTDTLIGLREDYGSTWNGRILIKDVTIHNPGKANLIYGLWFNHDFGYPTYIPSEIVVDGLTLTNPCDVNIFTERFVEQSKNALKDEIDGVPNINKMAPPKRIVIKNNKNGYKFITPDSPFFENTEFIVE